MMRVLFSRQTRPGLTLIEVLLSLAVIAIIAGIGIPVYQSVQVRNDLDIALVTMAQTLRRAQVLSQGMDGDTHWGVKIETGSITLFRGVSYEARETSFDEVFSMPESITPSGLSEVVLEKLTGFPQSTGTLTLTSSLQESKTLTLNEKGTISY